MANTFAALLRINGDALNASTLKTLALTDDLMATSLRRLTAGIITAGTWPDAELLNGGGGSSEWSSLLDPLDADLRARLLKYVDLVQATYDSFDRRRGTCRRGLRLLLPDLGLAGHGYRVTAFVYATCAVAVPHWLEREGHANWIGYVAVAGAAEARRAGYREIVVAWRGTISAREWLLDMKTEMVPFDASGKADHSGAAMVSKGFHSIYTSRNAGIKRGGRSAREQVAGEVARLVGHFRGEEVRVAVTGHSLGGALALLAARDVAAAHPDVPVAAVTFSAPRVGNSAFCDGLVSRAGVSVLRVVVRQDVVPTVPSVSKAPVVDALLSTQPLEKLWGRAGWSPEWAYVHAGDVLELDVTESPFLKHKYDPVRSHSLETCLHLLAGRESAAGEFRLDVNGRACQDVALASKTSDILRDELANCKGLRNKLGMWMLGMGKLEEEDDLPVQDDRLPLSELD